MIDDLPTEVEFRGAWLGHRKPRGRRADPVCRGEPTCSSAASVTCESRVLEALGPDTPTLYLDVFVKTGVPDGTPIRQRRDDRLRHVRSRS